MMWKQHLAVGICLGVVALACVCPVRSDGWAQSRPVENLPASPPRAAETAGAATDPLAGKPLGQDDLEEYGVVAPSDEVATGPEIGETMGPSTRRYIAMRIRSDGTTSQFYYIRQDHFMRLFPVTFDAGRLISLKAFGPHPVDASVRVLDGANYYFFPVCGPSISREQALPRQASKEAITLLTCQH